MYKGKIPVYAIIREANGQYYKSTVFGYYDKGRDANDYRHRYWAVLNKEKTSLMNQMVMLSDSKYLPPAVLIVDSDQTNWVLDNEKMKSVVFLPTESLYEMIEDGTIPDNVLQRCIDLDRIYVFEPYPDEYGQYWLDSKIFFYEGFVYLIDDAYVTVENARDGWCWFKARRMRYHVIPE